MQYERFKEIQEFYPFIDSATDMKLHFKIQELCGPPSYRGRMASIGITKELNYNGETNRFDFREDSFSVYPLVSGPDGLVFPNMLYFNYECECINEDVKEQIGLVKFGQITEEQQVLLKLMGY